MGETNRKLAVMLKDHRVYIDNTVKDSVYTGKRETIKADKNKSPITDHVCQNQFGTNCNFVM